MKKVLMLSVIMALSSAIAVNAAESKLESFVNQKISPLTQKEKEWNSKIEAQKKADAAKKAELEKKQAEHKKAIEAKKKELEKKQTAEKKAQEKRKQELQAQHEANKKAIEKEVNAWKSLFNN